MVLVVAVLGVLAVLAVGFVTLARLERKASSRRIATVRALLLARSGIEDALARLDAGQNPALLVNPLPGGFDSALPRETYSFRVEDESGKICVNGGFLDEEDREPDGIPDYRDAEVPGRGWNGQLTRILGNLGLQLGLPTLGIDLIAARPPGGYRSMAQVQAAARTTSMDLSPYLCLQAWTDLAVVRPNAQRTNFLAPSDLKRDRGALLLEEGGRPPVNLNAAPRAVLSALMKDLRGSVQFPSDPVISAVIPIWAPHVYRMTPEQADAVADAILAARPFGSWPEFEAFLDSLVPSVLNGSFSREDLIACGDLGLADLLKANFNPNTMLEKQMPDEISWRWMDKSDLLDWSTEGNLGPTGLYRLKSLGRVTDAAGVLLASASLTVTVRPFDLLRQTSQRDFVAGRVGNSGGTRYLSLASPSPLTPRGAGTGASWNTWGPGSGLAVMTYPCPMTAVAAGHAADYDGCIGLAAVETAHTNPFGGMLTFLHHFDDVWDADYVLPGKDGTRQAGPPGADGSLQTDCTRQVWPGASVEPNTLHPDGAFLQLGRSPSFLASNLPGDADATSDHGAISYWCKRNSCDNYVDTDFSCVRWSGGDTQVLAIGVAKSPNDYRMGLYLESWATARPPFADEEDRHAQGMRQEFVRYFDGEGARPYMPDLRWRLLGAFYDDDQAAPGEDVRLSVLGAFPLPAGTARYAIGNAYDAPSGEKLVQDPGAVFTLGGDGTVGQSTGFEVLVVMDEFAICDFTDDVRDSRPAFDAWLRRRFSDGRYYKEDDGAFLSAPLAPWGGRPVRILKVSWTERLPSQPGLESRRTDSGESDVQPLVPRLIDPRLGNVRLELDLLDAAGTLASPRLQPMDRPEGSALGRILPSFRYRVRFRSSPLLDPDTGLPDDLDQPLLETPFLDDITFAWQPAGGPWILSWER